MTRADPRKVAFEVLLAVARDGCHSDAALGNALSRTSLSDEDRRLAARLVYGTLAWQDRLDHTIRAYASRRGRIDPPAAIALRLGLLQLAILERIPDHAAVDTSVSLAAGVAPHARGFVNAVLRRAARDGLAPVPAEEPERTAVALSHPVWLVERWSAELGRAEAEALMAANNEAMPSVLRRLVDLDLAIAELEKRGVGAEPARFAPDAIVASRAVTIDGVAVPQGEASQLVTLMVAALPGERILDACAAPGGKTAYLAKLVGPSGRVVAVDPAADAKHRIGALLAATAVANVTIVNAPIETATVDGPFDAVLVDAPCSGLGTLREHPEIRWRRRPADIEDLARRQLAILDAAARHVRPGGRIVYATCTISGMENDDVVDRFLAEHSNFTEGDGVIPARLAPVCDNRGRLRTFPHRHGMGGFFTARMLRSPDR